MAVSEIGEENSWDAWKLFYCADFVRNFVVFVELYDPPARGREGRSVLASNYIKTLVDQRGWPREFLSQFHKSVCPFLLLPRKILLYRLFSWPENTTNARRQLRNGLRIILSYVLQPALTPDPVAHPPRPLYARQCVSACMPLYRPAFSFYNLLSTVSRLRRLATKSQVCVCVYVCTDTRCIRGCNVTTGTTWESVCLQEPRRRIEIHRGTIFVRSENHRPVLHRRRKLGNVIFLFFVSSSPRITHRGIITIAWILNFLSKINHGIYEGGGRVERRHSYNGVGDGLTRFAVL